MLRERVRDRTLWDSLQQVQQLKHHLNNLFSLEPAFDRVSFDYQLPLLNVWVSEQAVLIEAEIPGVDPKDVEISVVKEALTLKGDRKGEALKPGETHHRQERVDGKFARTIQLPFRVDVDRVEATFKRGVLSIKLPRAEEDKPKKITVKSSQ